MKKKLMILGAGRGQVDLIKTAKKMGYSTVVASIEGDYPGFEFADELCYVDICEPGEVAEAVKMYKVDGIATSCMDLGITALGHACEANGLVGLSEYAAKLSGNKLLMKSAFMENNVRTARYKKVSSLKEAMTTLNDFRLPLIVKAVDLQGSRGINIVYDKKDLMQGYERTMKETKKDFCIIEEFIEGYEFGAQAFVVNGQVLYVLPCGDITYLGNTKIPVGHYAPLDVDNEILNQVKEQVTLAIKAIQLDNCAVNVDMILKDGKIYVIELTGRVGANCLAQISSIYYGIDVYRMIIDTALGINPTEYFEKTKKAPTACYAKMLFSEKNGILKQIINKNEDYAEVVEITFFVKEGDTINKFTNSKDCLGQVVVKGKDLSECERVIDKVISNITFELK